MENVYDGKPETITKICGSGGVEIKFTKKVRYVNLKISTGSVRDNFSNICLYAEGRNISCTPNNVLNPGDTINFNDYTNGSADVLGQEFRLAFEEKKCIEIAELYIYYYEGT